MENYVASRDLCAVFMPRGRQKTKIAGCGLRDSVIYRWPWLKTFAERLTPTRPEKEFIGWIAVVLPCAAVALA